MISRPWLVFGAAPNPTLPEHVLQNALRVDINNSGRTAQMLGLGRADLTFRSKKKSWEEHPNLDTKALVWVHDRSNWIARLILNRKPLKHVGTMRVIRRRTRDMAVIQQSGVSPIDVGELGKVTNGVAAACYGLALGVPKVTLCGLSLRDVGHSYDQKGRRRRQLDEDLLVLRALAADERVSTTEHSLAEDAGIRLEV